LKVFLLLLLIIIVVVVVVIILCSVFTKYISHNTPNEVSVVCDLHVARRRTFTWSLDPSLRQTEMKTIDLASGTARRSLRSTTER